MTVNEFIEEYNKIENNKDKIDKFFEKSITTKYLPYAKKNEIAEKIARISTHIELDGKQVFKSNTVIREMLKDLNIIQNYTCININFEEHIFEQYDALLETNILPVIIGKISKYEITMLLSLIDMHLSDIYENERSIVGFIESKINATTISLETIMNAFNEVIKENPELLNSINNLKLI